MNIALFVLLAIVVGAATWMRLYGPKPR